MIGIAHLSGPWSVSTIGTVGKQSTVDAPASTKFRDRSCEDTAMSDEKLRSRSNLALWAAVALTLVPLVPYALGGGG